jgi:two-component sensor histidine kinase
MGKESSDCASIDFVKMRASGESPPQRDLRLEILDLRRRLKQAEVVASRHAVMLREADHRIKNSLQIVASLMTLQASRETHAAARDALSAAAARVRSIAGIHDALQGTIGEDTVDLGAVLGIMCTSLQAMAGDEGHISVITTVQELLVPVAFAQPIVLAVNELVVNALRHAFKGKNAGAVWVSLARDNGEVCITVSDNGVGLPANYAAGQGYGLRLVTMMTKQIDGDLRIESKTGASFTIRAQLERFQEAAPVANGDAGHT